MGRITTVRRTCIADQVVQQLTAAILHGDYAAGDRIPPERDLARQFGVTRTSVRDGLKRLEAFGMLSIKAGEGAFVRDIRREATLHAVEPLFVAAAGGQEDLVRGIQEFRVLLQTAAARGAAERRSDAEAETIGRLAHRLAETTDPQELSRIDWDLSHAVAAAAHNVIFPLVLNTVRAIHERWAPLYFSVPGVAKRTARYHRLIAEAIRRRSPARAERVMRLLLEYSNPLVFNQVFQFVKGPE